MTYVLMYVEDGRSLGHYEDFGAARALFRATEGAESDEAFVLLEYRDGNRVGPPLDVPAVRQWLREASAQRAKNPAALIRHTRP